MHRIDSATARIDANGAGKTGFSDNGDLPNQDATYFTPAWSNSLQEEVANVIEEVGIALDKNNNGQLLAALVQQFAEKQVLTDAVAEYKDLIKTERERIDELENRTYEDTQVGQLFWTTEHLATPEAVTTYKGYGTWERALQGRVAVGFSDIPDDHIDFRTHGKEYGEREHTLTIDEMPKHKHTFVNSFDGLIGIDSRNSSIHSWTEDIVPGSEVERELAHSPDGNTDTGFLQNTKTMQEGDQPHNNMQPSTTLDCWKRTA